MMDPWHKKVEEVSCPFGDNNSYIDESKDDPVSTDSDGEADDL